MDDLGAFCCLNPVCSDAGKRGHGNLTVTTRYGPNKSRRMLRCRTCTARFSERKGTPLFDARLPPGKVHDVLAHVAEGVGNRAEFPQPKSQKPGIGFPIVRACVLLSLATACVADLALGPHAGKKTGETALLRQLLGSFQEGDVAVADRYYCSFLMIALLMLQKVDVCVRMHQSRPIDFRRGKRLGPNDRLIVWTRPQRPEWMDEETYRTIPETLSLRMVRYNVVEPGYRVKSLTIVTTLFDPKTHTAADIAELYGYRWNAELDIRSIKQSLSLEHLRCKSPEMVRRELWTTLLGYNLVRTTGAAAALLHDKKPRQISFTGICQYVLASWPLLSLDQVTAENLATHCRTMLERIAGCVVGNRPGRIEPRVLKRRRHRYPLMQKPRTQPKGNRHAKH